MSALICRHLGLVPYGEASRLQERMVEARRAARIDDTLLLLTHPPVITLGRGADPGHVLVDDATLEAAGIEVHAASRGGDVTFHGPGQLVGYPITALAGPRRDAHRFLRDIEEGLIAAAADFGVRAARVFGRTGVWVGDAKLAAIGVRIGAGWITSHGFALNVGRDLSGFGTIVPCGIRGKRVTSLAELTGRDLEVEEVASVVAPRIAEALGSAAVWPEGPPARRTALLEATA